MIIIGAKNNNASLVLGGPGNSKVVVNGRDITGDLVGVDITADAKNLPALTLHLKVASPGLLDLLLTSAQVALSDESRDALISLGWTPPRKSPLPGRSTRDTPPTGSPPGP